MSDELACTDSALRLAGKKKENVQFVCSVPVAVRLDGIRRRRNEMGVLVCGMNAKKGPSYLFV